MDGGERISSAARRSHRSRAAGATPRRIDRRWCAGCRRSCGGRGDVQADTSPEPSGARQSVRVQSTSQRRLQPIVGLAGAVARRPLAGVHRFGRAGELALWIQSLDSLEARRVPGTGAPGQLFWSPDSRSVAFADTSASWKLTTIDIAGGLRNRWETHEPGSERGTVPGHHPERRRSPPADPGCGWTTDAVTTLDSSQARQHIFPTFYPTAATSSFSRAAPTLNRRRRVPGVAGSSIASACSAATRRSFTRRRAICSTCSATRFSRGPSNRQASGDGGTGPDRRTGRAQHGKPPWRIYCLTNWRPGLPTAQRDGTGLVRSRWPAPRDPGSDRSLPQSGAFPG